MASRPLGAGRRSRDRHRAASGTPSRLVTQLAEGLAVLAPSGAHHDFKVEVDLILDEDLELLAGHLADLADHGAAFADDDAPVTRLLDPDLCRYHDGVAVLRVLP